MYLAEAQITRYETLIKKTVSWVRQNQDRLLAETDIQAHYKAPYLWAVTGEMRMAATWRRQITDHLFRPDGDFRVSATEKGFRDFPCTKRNQYIYPNGWLISGLHKLGMYELSLKGLEFILKFQDPKWGGFYFSFDPKTNIIDKSLMDSSSTSAAGLACLTCGRMAEARRAGDFILRLLEVQPQPDKYFFSCMKQDGTVFDDVFSGENQWAADGRKQKCLSVEADASGELTWLMGKPTKFLTRLYSATGEAKYLEAAKKCFFFFHKLHPAAWHNYASCKTMWAGAELFRLTGEKVYADTAVRILDYYCETQLPSGAWVHTLWYKNEAEQSFCWTADITYEFGAEVSEVLLDLCSR